MHSCKKLATTLTLSNQARMLQLTDASVEDNINVFVVTMVTLIYLPASFVSVCLPVQCLLSQLTDRVNNRASRHFSE